MPLLDIATAQASLQNHLSPLGVKSLVHSKVLSSPFTFGDEKRPLSVWKSFHFPTKLNAYERSKLQIKAVATLELKCVVHKEDGHRTSENAQLDVDSDSSKVQAEFSSADSTELDERERLRRIRISKANRGNTPWNKGRKHSAETLQRIRERTKLAMQNPKIKMKLAKLGHAQSEETRMKIGAGVRMRWQKHREKMTVQETCVFEWQNLIAEASRRGYLGEEELQWDSYKILREKLEVEWVESVEQRKAVHRPKGSKRAPKSPEQRRKIAESIAAKWADPAYRERVCSAIAKYHGIPAGAERKPRRRPSTQSKKQDPTKKKTRDTNNLSGSDTTSPIQQLRSQRSKTPLYNDPLAGSKLEMIKNIRAQRAATETKKTEAIERARLLIAEAEKAAKALEVAATKSPVAQASLLESRKLITEAIQSLESIETVHITSSKNDLDPSLGPTERVSQVEMGTDMGNGSSNQAESKEVNGTKILASSKYEDLNFSNLSLHDILNGENELLSTNSSGYSLPSIRLESLVEQLGLPNQFGRLEPHGIIKPQKNRLLNGSHVQQVKEESPSKPISSTKKWVRGRLIEVKEGD
ncbi:hypothetical protein P3X46_001677 [Hevea brasiliensis]|uniref:Nuclease associated modular domain-containing protein n=1 Tax=Hevea brasiliensis TaxID=3981 RepID=A0ABQ9NJ60_HEVBR|nr:uncharacterized protein LOC110645397 [Hevea brasiliensis]KAJ9190479.1 hypothetical protein P3X46_001677 [Hevea brasiliensis]